MTRSHSRSVARLVRALPVSIPVLALSTVLAACGGSSPSATSATSSSANATCSSVSGTHHARVVVEASSTKLVSSCVGFSTPTISAVKLIDESDIEFGTQSYSYGLGICQADNVPAHYTTCFPSNQPYWALFTSSDGKAWVAAQVGVSDVSVHPGDSIGFRYDSQSGAAAPPPTPTPA